MTADSELIVSQYKDKTLNLIAFGTQMAFEIKLPRVYNFALSFYDNKLGLFILDNFNIIII